MALDTAPSHKAVALVGPAESGCPIIGSPVVRSVIMAILAEDVYPLDKEIFMAAAMRGMADETILLSGRMNPDKGAAFVDMAGIAEQVRGIGHDHCL